MATFGRYEADRPLYRTAFSTVYALRSTEEGGRQRVIKAQKLSVRMHDETLEAAQGQAFLDSATVQQKAARFEAESWAPVHELGTALTGPFYVTDRYDFSIQGLVDGHVKLGAAGLHNVISAIVRGLLALRQACQRPHGNLKCTNILIAGHRDLSQAQIVLCDPLPDRHLDPNAHALADLRRLGEIIHQVVVHSEVPPIAGYQVPPSAHWRKLGKQGEAWRHLCNRLLQANVDSAPITLEDLAAQLAALTPRRSRRWLLIAPMAVTLVIVSVVVALLRGRPPTVEEAIEAYNECDSARDWLGPLEQELAKSGKYMNHPWIKEDNKLARLNDIGSYERVFLRDNIPTIADLSSARDAGDLRTKVAAADAARKGIKALLFEPGAKDYWPWLAKLGECAAQLAEAGCHDMSNFLLGEVVPKSPPDANLVARIDAAFRLKQGWTTVDFGRLQPDAVRNDPNRGQDDLNLDPQGRKTLKAAEFTRRLSLLERHYRLGPNEPEELNTKLEEALRMAQGLLDDLKDPLNKDNATRFTNRVTEYKRQLVAIQQKPPLARTQGHRATVKNLLQEMIANIEPHVANRAKWHEEIIVEAQQGISKSSRALNDWYNVYVRARLGDDPKAFSNEYKDRTRFGTLRSNVEGTRTNLVKLDGTLAATLDTKSVKTPWSEALREHYKTKREQILGDITRKAGQSDLFPDPDKQKDEWNDLLGWPARAAQLVQDFHRVETSLEQCYRQDDPLPGPPPKTVKSLFARWNKDPNRTMVAEISRLAGAETFRDLVEFLESVETGKDIDALRATAQDVKKPIGRRYAALWRVLQKSSPTIGQEDPGLRMMESLAKLRVSEGSQGPPGQEDFAVWVKPLVDFLASPQWPERYDHTVFEERYARRLETRADFDQWRAGYAKCERITSISWSPKKTWKELCDDVAWSRKAELLEKDAKKKDLWDFFSQRYSDLQLAFESGRKARLVKEDERKILDWETVVSEPKNLGTLGPIRSTEDAKRLWANADNHTLRTLVKMVDLCIKPEYCKYVDPDIKEPGKLMFVDTPLRMFRPHLPRQLTGPGPFDLSQFNDNPKLAEGFFESIDSRDPGYGWPRYIEAREDPSVILRLVRPRQPSDPPFYMAVCEITNKQFRTFLNAPNAQVRPSEVIAGGDDLLHPYSSWILHPRSNSPSDPNAPQDNHPVVWVTFPGAKRYATWLGAELPTIAEHRYAAELADPQKAFTNADRYNIRTTRWTALARVFNRNQNAILKAPIPPAGAEDPAGESRDSYNETELANEKLPEPGAYCKSGKGGWPTASSAAERVATGDLETDRFVIYDLIGNVWEWCEDRRCCGGSCLSSLTDLASQNVPDRAPARPSDCDLGFRVVVHPKGKPG